MQNWSLPVRGRPATTGSRADDAMPPRSSRTPARPAFRHAESLEPRLLFASSNDPLWADQYALANAGVPDAWGITRGSAAAVVADIDTGADYTHEDLYANIWINQAEIPQSIRTALRDADGDGRISFYDLNDAGNRALVADANGNGYVDAGDLLRPAGAGGWEDGVNGRSNGKDRYVDDIIGWDFADGDNDPFDGGPRGGHGTHTAGIIGAAGNNGVGVSGVAQKVSMIVVRIFDDAGDAAAAPLMAEAVRYTADSGARVANASWQGGGSRNRDVLHGAIAYGGRKGQLFVTASGNDGRDIDSRFFNVFPAEYNLPCILAVGATTATGAVAPFSNFGAATVDLLAPGAAVLSTLPGDRYGVLSGTSMAAPFASGAAALMLSQNPSLTLAQLKHRLVAGVNASRDLKDRSASGGGLSAINALTNRRGARLPAAPRVTAVASSVAERIGMSLGRAHLFSSRRIRASFTLA